MKTITMDYLTYENELLEAKFAAIDDIEEVRGYVKNLDRLLTLHMSVDEFHKARGLLFEIQRLLGEGKKKS